MARTKKRVSRRNRTSKRRGGVKLLGANVRSILHGMRIYRPIPSNSGARNIAARRLDRLTESRHNANEFANKYDLSPLDKKHAK